MVDSTGADWNLENDGDDVIMEKVALSLVDDLTIGDAINFYTIAEAPFRPFLTYRAQCSMEGPLVPGPPTQVRHHRATLKPEHDERPRPPQRTARAGPDARRHSRRCTSDLRGSATSPSRRSRLPRTDRDESRTPNHRKDQESED